MYLKKEINSKEVDIFTNWYFFVNDFYIKNKNTKGDNNIENINNEVDFEFIKENHIKVLSENYDSRIINFYFFDNKDLKDFTKNDLFIKSLQENNFLYRFYFNYSDFDLIDKLVFLLKSNKINFSIFFYVNYWQELKKNIYWDYLLKISLNNDYSIIFDKIKLLELQKYINENNIKWMEIDISNLDDEKLKEINILKNMYEVFSKLMIWKIFKTNIIELFWNNKTTNLIKYESILKQYLTSFISKEDKYINIYEINDLEVANYFYILLLYNQNYLHILPTEKTRYLTQNNFFNILYLMKNYYIKNWYIKILWFDNYKNINKIELLEHIQELILNDTNIKTIYKKCLYHWKKYEYINNIPQINNDIYKEIFNNINKKILEYLI